MVKNWKKVEINGQLAKYMIQKPEMIKSTFSVSGSDSQAIQTYLQAHADKVIRVEKDSSKREASEDGVYEHFEESLYQNDQVSVYRGYDNVEGSLITWSKISMDALQLSHPNVREDLKRKLDLEMNVAYYIDTWASESNQINIISHHLPGVILRHELQNRSFPTTKLIKKWTKQIVRGLIYLNTQQTPITHKKLKCENIVVDTNSGNLQLAVVIDEISKEGNSKQKGLLSQTLKVLESGQVLIVPEMVDEDKLSMSKGENDDVFNFGRTLLEIATRSQQYGLNID